MISEGCVNNEKKAIVKCIYGGRWYTYNIRDVVCVRACVYACVCLVPPNVGGSG